MVNFIKWSLLMVGLLSLTAGCSEPVTSEEFLQSYQVRSGTVVEVLNRNGNINITGWDEEVIEIKALKESLHGPEALEEVDINIDIAEILTIETVYSAGSNYVSVDYEIKVPGDLLVGAVESTNGNVTLENVSGNPLLNTSNGSITAVNVNGIVTAETSNGNITATGVRSLAGLNTSNGNITAELSAIHEDLVIETSNGSISLLLSPALAITLNVQTSNGQITAANLNFDQSEINQTRLSGLLNGGGYRLAVLTSNGSVELAPLR